MNKILRGRSGRALIATAAMAAMGLGVAAVPSVAGATATTSGTTSVSTTVTGGTLSFCNAAVPASATFKGVTLNGSDVAADPLTGAFGVDVCDNTGSGAGWTISFASTAFSNGASTNPYTIAGKGMNFPVPGSSSDTCDTAGQCTLATNSVSALSVPAKGETTAANLFDAAAATGMGDQTIDFAPTLDIPANTYAASYSSTWTITLASGPASSSTSSSTVA